MHEFDLIQKYFTWEDQPSDVVVSVGDDAAILNITENQQLVTSIDTFISGVHFPENTSPFDIGYKALAVNLSDLAAMGATPKWFTLALTLPDSNKKWLNAFSQGLKLLAQQHQCFLVGGDTTKGPLSISIQVMGLVDKGKALLRSSAMVGDKIYVTGTLGDAALGLKNIQEQFVLSDADKMYCQQRLNRPTPRVDESKLIKDVASACIDCSDGFLQDLSHILNASKVGAQLNLSALPLSQALKNNDRKFALNCALTGGDDYELLFTIPADSEIDFVNKMKSTFETQVTCVGVIIDDVQKVMDENGNSITETGYKHFS